MSLKKIFKKIGKWQPRFLLNVSVEFQKKKTTTSELTMGKTEQSLNTVYCKYSKVYGFVHHSFSSYYSFWNMI